MSHRSKALWKDFEERPEEDATFIQLFHALNEQREHEQLAELYRRRAEAVDEEQAIYLYLTVADDWSQRLGMPGLATEALFAAYERDPPSNLLRDRLHQHLEAESDWNMYARFLTLELQHTQSPTERGRLHLAFGHLLHRRLHDISEAARMYLEAAGSAPSREAAILAMRRLNHAEPNFADVSRALKTLTGPNSAHLPSEIERLEAQLTQIPPDSTGRRSVLLGQLAQALAQDPALFEDSLTRVNQSVTSDPAGLKHARALLPSLVLAVPESARALRSLLNVVKESPHGWTEQDWRTLLQVARMGPLLTDEPELRFELLMLLAEITGFSLSDPESAASLYLRAASTDRNREQHVQDALARLLEHAPQARAVRAALRELLTASRRPNALVDYWQRLATLAYGKEERAEALWERGLSMLDGEESSDLATQTLRQAIGAANEATARHFASSLLKRSEGDAVSNTTIDLMRLLAANNEQWEPLAALLKRRVDDLSSDVETRFKILTELVDVLVERLQRPGDAVTLIEQVATAEPHIVRYATMLRTLHVALGDLTAAKRALASELRLANHPSERCQLLLERTKLEEQSGEPIEVMMTLGELLHIRPGHPRAREMVTAHFLGEEAPEHLKQLLKQKASRLSVRPQSQRLQALGRVLLNAEETRNSGLELLLKAFRLAPGRFDGLDALKQALKQANRDDALEEITEWLQKHPIKAQRGRASRALTKNSTAKLPIASLRLDFEREPTPKRFQELEGRLRSSNDLLALADLHVWASQHATWLDDVARDKMFEEAEVGYRKGGATHEQLAWLQSQHPDAADPNDPSTTWSRILRNPHEEISRRRAALESLYIHHEQNESWTQFQGQLDAAIQRAEEPEWKRDLLFHLAELWRQHLDDPARAQDIARRLHEASPDSPRDLVFYASMLEPLPPELLGSLHAVTPEQALHLSEPLRMQLARLQYTELGDWQAALDTYRALILAAQESDAEALLGQLCVDLIDTNAPDFDLVFNAILNTLDALHQHTPTLPAQVHILRLRARLLTREVEALGDAEEAWKTLLDEHPNDPEGLIAMAQLREQTAAWSESIQFYEAYLETHLDPEERAAVHHRLGDLLLEHFDAATRARLHYQRALEITPDNPQLQARLAALGVSPRSKQRREGSAGSGLSALPRNASDVQGPVPSRENLKALEALVEEDPLDEAALKALEAVCRELGEYSKLVETLGRRAGLIDDDDQSQALLFERATLLSEELSDPSASITAHRELLERFPDYTPSLEALAELYKRLGHHAAAIEILPRLMQAIPERRLEIVLEIARILEKHLHRPEEAFTQYRWAHELAPDDPMAIRQMWRIANQHGLWEALIGFLEHDFNRAEEPSEQVERLREIATLAEQRLSDPYRAFHTLRMAFQIAPDDASLLEDIELLAEEGNYWQDLAALYRNLADVVEDPRLQIEHLCHLATLTEHRLSDPVAAFDVLCEALTVEPEHQEVLERLDTMATTHDLWEERLAANVERLGYTDQLDVQQAILLDSAKIYLTHYNDADNATEFLLRAWVLVPEDEAILQQLIDLCGSPRALAERVLNFTAPLDPSAVEPVWVGGMRLRALVLERFLSRDEEALETLRHALEVTPHSELLFDALLTISARLNRLSEITSALDAVLRSLDAPSARAFWLERKAQAELLAQNHDAAHDALSELLELVPDHPEARTHFEHLEREHLQRPQPRRAKLSVRSANDTQQAIQALTHDLPAIRSPEARALQLWEVAKLQRDELDQLEAAEESLKSAHSEHPAHYEIARDLSTLLYRGRKTHEAKDLQSQLISTLKRDQDLSRKTFPRHLRDASESDEDNDHTIYRLRNARCFEVESRYRDALALYDVLLLESPGHLGARAGQARSLHKSGNWKDARELLDVLMGTDGLTDRLSHADLAELYRSHGDLLYGAQRLDEAQEAFERALTFNPQYRPAADQALAVLIEQKKWSETPAAFHRLLALTHDPEVQGAIHKRLGEVHEYFLEQPKKAIFSYEQAVVLGGDTADVPPRLLRLYAQQSDWEKAHIIAEILLEQAPPGTKIRTDLLLVLGDVLGKGLGRTRDALGVYHQALKADPVNTLALDRIGNTYGEMNHLEEIHVLYTDFIKRLDPENLTARVEVLRRYGQLLQKLGQSPSSGLEVFKNLADLVPDDVEIHTRLFNLFTGEDGAIHNPVAELVHLRKLISLGKISIEFLERILDLYMTLGEEEGIAEIKTLLAIAHGHSEIIRDAPATPRAEFGPGTISGQVYEDYIAESYAVGSLARFFEHVVEVGLGELSQQVELSGMITVEELTRLSQTPAAERFQRLRQALGLGRRRLFVRSDLDTSYQVFSSNPPSITLSEKLVQGRSENDWRFILARTLELSRPRFLLATSLGPFSFLTMLRTLLVELSSDHRDTIRISLIDHEAEEKVRKFLSTLRSSHSLEVQEDFQSLADQILIDSPEEGPSAKHYVLAARTTSVRVGLLACNDQRIAIDYLMREEFDVGIEEITGPGAFIDYVERSNDLKSLVSYIISEKYLQARNALMLPRTELSNLIKLPPREISRLTPAPTAVPSFLRDIAAAVSTPVTNNTDQLFGAEIDDLIDALPLEEMGVGSMLSSLGDPGDEFSLDIFNDD